MKSNTRIFYPHKLGRSLTEEELQWNKEALDRRVEESRAKAQSEKKYSKGDAVQIQRGHPERKLNRMSKRLIKKSRTCREVRAATKAAWGKAKSHPKYGNHRCYRVLAVRAVLAA